MVTKIGFKASFSSAFATRSLLAAQAIPLHMQPKSTEMEIARLLGNVVAG
jgi:hypothetical protein